MLFRFLFICLIFFLLALYYVDRINSSGYLSAQADRSREGPPAVYKIPYSILSACARTAGPVNPKSSAGVCRRTGRTLFMFLFTILFDYTRCNRPHRQQDFV